MIPAFNELGLLPDGIHDCTLEEAAERFGRFHVSDRRSHLWAKFTEFVTDAKACKSIKALLVDGSFVTTKSDPEDIDLVLVLARDHDFAADLAPAHYNVLAQQRVRKNFGFDIVVVRSGANELDQAITFFQQVKQRPGINKGILRISL